MNLITEADGMLSDDLLAEAEKQFAACTTLHAFQRGGWYMLLLWAELPYASGVPGTGSARPLSEWHEDDGPVVWWKFPVDEPAWIGTPNCDDWPGYHTHWTPHPAIPTAGVEGKTNG